MPPYALCSNQFRGHVPGWCTHFTQIYRFFFVSLYDVDGNGYIDINEMTKLVTSIYKMVGTAQIQLEDTPVERAHDIFDKMDLDSDGKITKEEFTKTCLGDKNLLNLLAPK